VLIIESYLIMDRIVYYLYYAFINIFRIVPFWLLYLKSSFLYFVLYHLVGYRKSVVIDNLTKCFPDKSEKEIMQLAKRFYKENLSDIFVEGLKGFTMTEKHFKTRYKVLNPEILDKYFNQGQDVLAIATHYGNWEWGIQVFNNQVKHQAAALYKPLTNKYIEEYSKSLREKSGIHLVSIRDTLEYFQKKKDKPVIYIMAADQFPGGKALDKAVTVNFLGRETLCLHGPESYARYNKLPTFFFDVKRVKRGHYTLEIKLLADKPYELEKGELTKRYMKNLEQAIYREPQNWLWSHKRWKNENFKKEDNTEKKAKVYISAQRCAAIYTQK